VNLEDLQPCCFVGVGKLDLTIDTAGTKQGWVKDINAVCAHENLAKSRKGEVYESRVIKYVQPRSKQVCGAGTLIFCVGSNPSSWLSNSNMVRCTSESPPPPDESIRVEPIESISSMKMIDGACSLCRWEEQLRRAVKQN